MKNVYLTGFMGTGKTTVARLLAERTEREFVEMDGEIEQSCSMSVNEIFSSRGEPFFRDRETAVLRDIAGRQGLIVSCGGGVVCRRENRELMSQSGLVVCLSASARTIYERLKSKTDRPLLKVSDPLDRITGLLDQRQAFYDLADYIIDTEGRTPEEVCSLIGAVLKKEEPSRGIG